MDAIERRHRTGATVVAGGSGFLGSHMCRALLDRGHSVICIDSFVTGSHENIEALLAYPRFRLVEHDICRPLELKREDIGAVYNLACAASPPRYQADPVHTMLTSVDGTHHLLCLAEQHGARFLQASTSEVYGDPEQHPQAEHYVGHVNCTGPRSCYDEGKRAAESLCFDFLRCGRVDARVARIFNTYGPRMRADDGRVVSNLICQALAGEPLTIYGNGAQTRSFCYVSDLIGGLIALMEVEKTPSGPVNLGNPREFTVKQLADIISEKLAVDTEPVHLPLPQDDPKRRRPDIARARELLNWQPRISLEEGISRTIDWFMEANCKTGDRAETEQLRALQS